MEAMTAAELSDDVQLQAAESVVLMVDRRAGNRLQPKQRSFVMRDVEDALQRISTLSAESRAQCQCREFKLFDRPHSSPAG